jgi:PAS domain S-box-containing protein
MTELEVIYDTKDLEMDRARLAAVIASSFDAIIAKDLNSTITDWNPAAERMFGYTAAEAIGRDVRMLIPDTLVDEETEIIRRIRAGERIESYETIRRRKDGTLIPVSLTVSPILDDKGRVVGASKIARDITATKESEHRIRLLLREINHRVKNQYAVIMAVVRETGRRSSDVREFQDKIGQRIAALAASHDLLVQTEWSGSPLMDLIEAQMAPFEHNGRLKAVGPSVHLSPGAVQNIGLALHELGTNSAKHGVFSGRPGRVELVWNVGLDAGGSSQFTMAWDEHFDAPLPSTVDSATGFGSVVLNKVAADALNGEASLRRESRHISWVLKAPLADVTDERRDSWTG